MRSRGSNLGPYTVIVHDNMRSELGVLNGEKQDNERFRGTQKGKETEVVTALLRHWCSFPPAGEDPGLEPRSMCTIMCALD